MLTTSNIFVALYIFSLDQSSIHYLLSYRKSNKLWDGVESRSFNCLASEFYFF
jgi:hypothetical protein